MAMATIISILFATLFVSIANSDTIQIPSHHSLLQCLSEHSSSSSPNPISELTFFPNSPSYSSVLNAYIRNLRFTSPTTPHPLFILAPTHISHIQSLIICTRIYGLQIRTRSGGHDYEGFSYVSDSPFVILDMFNLRSVAVHIDQQTAWVESGATLGELYFKIAEKSNVHGFPAGVCPTVGVGGHVSGGGYGNLIRKFGVSVDNVVDALLVDVNGRVLDRESMGEDLFWALRGGGGASFGIIVAWKVKLVPVPEIVTVFRVERTTEEGAVDILDKWQQIADVIDENLFIRVVIVPDAQGSKARFNSLFLGNAQKLLVLMSESFPELGLKAEDCLEMSWIESAVFWADYLNGTSLDILLERQPIPERYWKIKSDYVQEAIPKAAIEGIMKKMSEQKVGTTQMTLNPYGGKMREIAESEIAFPHRAGNKYKIQYLVTWAEEEGEKVAAKYLKVVRELYEYMTPYVSRRPRSAFLNYRDADLGVNGNEVNGNESYAKASKWGRSYFKGNFDRLVKVKTMVDPDNFFRYEQSIPSLALDSNGRAQSL